MGDGLRPGDPAPRGPALVRGGPRGATWGHRVGGRQVGCLRLARLHPPLAESSREEVGSEDVAHPILPMPGNGRVSGSHSISINSRLDLGGGGPRYYERSRSVLPMTRSVKTPHWEET